MGSSAGTRKTDYTWEPLPSPLSIYVPLQSLTKQVVRSVIAVVNSVPARNFDSSERTLLIFLLAIDNKLKEIENNTLPSEDVSNQPVIQHAKKVREWLVYDNDQPLDWDKLRQVYDETDDHVKNCCGERKHGPYHELTVRTVSC